MSFLTRIEGVPDRDDAIEGMAHFAGSGPVGKTCGDCKHHGGLVRSKRRIWDRCAMFKQLTGEHGPEVSKYNKSCRYFEPRQHD
jgi:hypothetical protein